MANKLWISLSMEKLHEINSYPGFLWNFISKLECKNRFAYNKHVRNIYQNKIKNFNIQNNNSVLVLFFKMVEMVMVKKLSQIPGLPAILCI